MFIPKESINLLLKHTFRHYGKKEGGGASVRLADNAVLGIDFKPETGYMVGVKDILISEDTETISDLVNNIFKKASQLDNIPQQAFIGSWISDRLYVDLSLYITDKEEALELGRKYNQLAIYDIKNKGDIKI